MPSYKLTKKQNRILERAKARKTAGNYADAYDGDISAIRSDMANITDYISGCFSSDHKFPTGLSNCTLTATQWVDPKHPLMRAQTILDKGKEYGYREIPEYHAYPRDLVIATNPNDNSHHTMLITGFTQKPTPDTFLGKDYILPTDHPLVTYSRGTIHPSSYRRSIGLMEYLDNSEGKTDVKYYRHFSPGQRRVLLPRITVTPKGNFISNDKPIKVYQGDINVKPMKEQKNN